MNTSTKENILWLCIIFMVSAIAISIIINVKDSNNKKYIDLKNEISKIRTDVDILKGQMKTYENLPADMRSRIEILETRYDNLVFFQDQLKKPEEIIYEEEETENDTLD